MSAYLKAIRPHQWMKNVLVFLPMLAAQQFTGASVLASLLAFVAFSLVASSVYVLNDLHDLDADRAHPRKRLRPFAAGNIPIASGTWMATGLLGLGAAIAAFLGPAYFGAMIAYYALTTGYSLYLKRRIVVDICVLTGLYTVRIVAGGVTTGMGDQSESERDTDAAAQIMRRNYEGPASILAVLANRFDDRGNGTLVGISSVAGERGHATIL